MLRFVAANYSGALSETAALREKLSAAGGRVGKETLRSARGTRRRSRGRRGAGRVRRAGRIAARGRSRPGTGRRGGGAPSVSRRRSGRGRGVHRQVVDD